MQSKVMDSLSANIRNADTDSARKITNILYQLVDDKKIKSFKIKRIVKGKNSINLGPFVPLLDKIDFETLYQSAKESGLFDIGKGYIGIRIIREILSIVSNGITAVDKIKGKKSLFGVSCRINKHQIVKYGRSFGIEPFDTLLTSAMPDSVKEIFLGERKWGEIKIAKEKYFSIQFIAIFVKRPIASITHIGRVSHIEFNPENGKSTVFLEGKPKEIKPKIPYDKNYRQHNAHGTLYTTKERIDNAKTLADVYPSLDYRKK